MANLPFIGELKHRIKIVQRTEEADMTSPMGANIIKYVDKFCTWASKEDVGFEDIYNDRGTGRGVTTDVFIIRNNSKAKTIDNEMYIESYGKRYKIRGLKEVGDRDRFLAISAEMFERNV